MIFNYWPHWFRKKVGGSWPDSYVCVDIESSGYSFDQDVITEWGHCLVEDGKVVDQLSLVIDWTGRTSPPDHWLQNRLRQVRQGMELAGRTCHMSYDRMTAEGVKPDEAFKFIRDFTTKLQQKRMPFVAHGGSFDEKMLSANFLQFKYGNGYSFGDVYIDTEAIEKASQIPDNVRVHPKASDTLREYFNRVKYTRITGLKSNMDEHCFTKYQFHEKHGIDKREMHAARMDSYCCHLLMQEFATQVTDPIAAPVYPVADDKAARKPEKATAAPLSGLKRIRGQRRS